MLPVYSGGLGCPGAIGNMSSIPGLTWLTTMERWPALSLGAGHSKGESSTALNVSQNVA